MQGQQGMVFVDYQGLSVPEMNDLRREIRSKNARLQVVKKTLLERALRAYGISLDVKALQGQIAAIFAFGDPVEAVKGAHAFSRSRNKLRLVGGYIDGQELSGAMAEAVAELPSKRELRGRLVGSIASPLSGLLRVAQGPVRGLAVVLRAIGEEKS